VIGLGLAAVILGVALINLSVRKQPVAGFLVIR
jgi:hypothetical protein